MNMLPLQCLLMTMGRDTGMGPGENTVVDFEFGQQGTKEQRGTSRYRLVVDSVQRDYLKMQLALGHADSTETSKTRPG
jgi:hypothetical protein